MLQFPHLAAVLLAIPLVCSADPPANDDFTSAHQLGSALPATHFTSNVEATLEPTEPDPTGNGGTSVWYTWTATNAGWHAVSTLGSDYDTVLYVFTGGSLDSLQLVSRSDDASSSELQSLARFRTAAGTTYHIAVHGYAGETGNTFFDIDALVPPPLHVTSVDVAASPADLATADSSVTLHVGVASPDGFSDGSVGLSTPVGGIPGASFTRFDAADRIAGDALAGTYAVTVPLPRYGAAGDWPIDLQIFDTTAGQARYGHPTAGDIFPADIATTHVAASNSGDADTAPPTLGHVSFSPASVDVSDAPQTVTIMLEIADTLSGTGSAIIDLLDPFSNFYDRLFATETDLDSGDINDGTFTIGIQIPRFVTPGTYTIDDLFPLDVIDRTGNRRSYGPQHTPYPAGSTTSFTVVNTTGTDTAAPALTSATVTPADADIGPAPVTVTATFTATDDLSGITSGTVSLELPSGELVSAPFDTTHRTAGNATLGTYSVPLQLGVENIGPGTHPLVIGLRDAVGFTSEYGGTFGDLIPVGGTHAVTVTDSGPAPGTSPYERWVASYPALTGPDAGPGADPDHDTFTNLAELAFGLDPTRDSSPGGADPASPNAPTLTKTQNSASLTYAIVPSNLTAYNHPPITVTPVSTTDLKSTTPITPVGLGADTYRATIPITNQANHLRLQVTAP